MSDDLNKKIKQITDILGQENMPDNLKGLLSLLASPGVKQDSSPKVSEPLSSNAEKSDRSEPDENIEMIRKVKKLMDRINTVNDPRISLLNAIKPFLNKTRQKKIGNCIKLLHMSWLVKFIDENEKSFN